jgi:hypothetical protein
LPACPLLFGLRRRVVIVFPGLAIHLLTPENTPMHRTTGDEQGQFGFLPIFLVAAAVALTTAAVAIAFILSWVYLREHNSGVVSGVFSQPSVQVMVQGHQPALVAGLQSGQNPR